MFGRGSQSDWAEGDFDFGGLSLFFQNGIEFSCQASGIWWAVNMMGNLSFFFFFSHRQEDSVLTVYCSEPVPSPFFWREEIISVFWANFLIFFIVVIVFIQLWALPQQHLEENVFRFNPNNHLNSLINWSQFSYTVKGQRSSSLLPHIHPVVVN